jgi:hypothetical protein
MVHNQKNPDRVPTTVSGDNRHSKAKTAVITIDSGQEGGSGTWFSGNHAHTSA